MCEKIEGFSEVNVDRDWSHFGDKKESSVAVLNRCKREMTILGKDGRRDVTVCKGEPHESSLLNRFLTHTQAKIRAISPLEAGGSGQVDFTVSWGAKEGPSWSGGVSAQGHDDKGNYVEVKVQQESSGEGSARVSAGHEKNGK